MGGAGPEERPAKGGGVSWRELNKPELDRLAAYSALSSAFRRKVQAEIAGRAEYLSHSERWTLVHRPDLLAEEASLVAERGINWRGRLADLGGYGRSGGSAGDRRLIVEAMAKLERWMP